MSFLGGVLEGEELNFCGQFAICFCFFDLVFLINL